MIPNTTFAFNANSILKGTCASVTLKTFAAVANPRLTEVADGTLDTTKNLKDIN